MCKGRGGEVLGGVYDVCKREGRGRGELRGDM